VETYNYPKSQALFKRAAEIIPCGTYGHLSATPQVPPTAYPLYTSRAEGCRFWDIDGNEFIDYMCAYGPMVLGYNHPAVDNPVREQYAKGNCTTTPAPAIVELAECLIDTITNAEWAYFAKNGTDVTTYATMVARAETGRKKIVLFRGGYHGTVPWAQGFGHHGITEEDRLNIIMIDWNKFEQFQQVVDQYPKQIAAIMGSPYDHRTFGDNVLPGEGYWQKVQALCNKEGIVLINDDVRCGFRLDMRGSDQYFGFESDLTCFCKAIGNGYPISALVGKSSLKNAASKVFYTGSYWFSAAPMVAATATINELKRIDGPKMMLDTGKKLLDGMVDIGKNYGYDLKVTGAPSMPYLRITNDESTELHQDWCAECTKRGAFFTMHHNWFISCAHGEKDIQDTWNIVDDAFKAVKKKYGDRF
jgi:glutamate-1-semialdehyde 2,1-aminomutase